MAELTDETLMAYADGALDPAARAAVEAELARNPEYLRKLQAFRATSAPVARAFRQEMAEGDYDHLIAEIRQGELRPLGTAKARGPLVGGMSQRPHVPALHRHFPTAMAACVALLIGGGLGWLAHSPVTLTPPAAPEFVEFVGGNLQAQGELGTVLESARSGRSVVARGVDGRVWTLRPSFTFRSASRLPCRQYEISNDAAGRYAGYACRSGDGRWLVHAHVAVAPKALESKKGHAPADGDGNPALNAAVHTIMDGDVVQTDEEAALISGRWASDRK